MDVAELGGETVEWDGFVHACPDGTPFHLTAWKRAVEQVFPHRAHYLFARHAGAIEGVLPLFEVRGLLGGRALLSVPYAVYAGICARTDEARRALLDAATRLAWRLGADHVELRHQRDQGLGLPTKDRYVAFSREIHPTDEENLSAIPRKQRRMVRQGPKHGLTAAIGMGRHLEECWDVYAESVRNLGSPVFPRALFAALQAAFDKDCQILTVHREGRVVAGVLTLFHEDRVLPYYGGARRDALPYAVNDFMYWELMRYAAATGCRVFDFGRSRVGTGSYHFKRHWGFEPTPLPYQYVLLKGQGLPDLSPSNPRFDLAIRAWQRLPLPVANRVGPWLTRYLP
ncbi:MAG: FemAB family PEP-CTERM system-associated protein [Candidatus Rokubacteria bacterium]|nr:FemAB family PEP-CTERM system-associated protein [Candidatus Rokubacteria bacterium]